jgi:hypothetical protein
MIFLAAADEPTMFILLTEQDMNDIRGGQRTKFVDKTATKGFKFDKVVISLHKNQAEIEAMLKQAGHAKLLQNMPSIVPQHDDAVCAGCAGTMKAYMLLEGRCIACWRETAKAASGGAL